MRWQGVLAAQKAHPGLGCIKRSVASRSRRLRPSALVRAHVEHCLVVEPSAQGGRGAVGAGPRR